MQTLFDTGDVRGGDDAKMRKVSLVETPRCLVGANVLKPGQTAPAHVHAKEDKTYYVLSGEGIIEAGEETHRVRAGHLVFCPAGMPHGVVNDGAEDLRLLVTMTPHPKPQIGVRPFS